MTDVRLTQTLDGGEMEVINGRVTFDDGPATATYLSLFGGNDDDAGTVATEDVQWWGNLLEEDPARHMRSETQHLLRSLPATAFNLRRIEDAVGRDLAWMTTELGAEVESAASIPQLNRVQIDVEIRIDGQKTELRITEPWST